MAKEKRIPRTYKLTEETLGQITELAEKERATYTEVVERAVSELYQGISSGNTGEIPENTAGNTALELLGRQLEVKDKQIESLNEALLAAQETAKAAQVLHGAEKAEHVVLESVEQKEERLSRWERLRKAWRG